MNSKREVFNLDELRMFDRWVRYTPQQLVEILAPESSKFGVPYPKSKLTEVLQSAREALGGCPMWVRFYPTAYGHAYLLTRSVPTDGKNTKVFGGYVNHPTERTFVTSIPERCIDRYVVMHKKNGEIHLGPKVPIASGRITVPHGELPK